MAERLVYKFSSRGPTSEFTGGVYDDNKLKSQKTKKDQSISWIMAERSSNIVKIFSALAGIRVHGGRL